MNKPHPTNVWGSFWRMTCHCDLNCFTMPCPVHYRAAYIKAAEVKQKQRLIEQGKEAK